MKTLYNSVIIIFLIAALIGIGYLIFDRPGQSDELDFSGKASEPRDVFGTRSATTTTATADGSFLNPADEGHATVTKALWLGGMTDMAIVTFKAIDASSTSFFQYDIFASNDNGCDTIATSTTDDNWSVGEPFVQDVNWYDIGASNTRVSGLVSNPSLSANASGTVEVLTNLNWKCLRVDLQGASTTVWAQLREKINY